jgi:hypothetical protein
MVVRWLALAVVIVSGCDYALGLRSFDPTPDAPDVIVNQGTVTVTYTWLVSNVDPNGAPHLVPMPAPVDELDVKAALVDGTILTVARMPDGSAVFHLPAGAPYVLTLQTKDATYATEIQTASASIELSQLIYDHPATFATQPTPVTFFAQLQQNPTSGVPFVASLGVRTLTAFNGSALIASLDWRGAKALAGAGPLLSTTTYHDRLIYERFLDTGSYQYISDADVEAVEMTDGVPVQFGSSTTPRPVAQLALERCVHVVAPRATELARVETSTGATGNADSDWQIVSHLFDSAPLGESFQLAAGTSPIADESVDVRYSSPYPGEVDAAVLDTVATRDVTHPGSQPLTVYYGSDNSVTPPNTTCGSVTFSPTTFYDRGTLAGTDLAADGVVVMIDRSAPVPFAFTTTSEPYDDVPTLLYEVEDAAGTTALRPVRAYDVAGATSVTIDPTLLAQNHYYMFELTPRTGYPNARQLDFRTFSYPASSTTSYTKMFKIGN